MAEKKEEVKKWETIELFEDEDGKNYKKGDAYPRPANKKVTQKRLEELSTKKNKYKRPFIKEK